MQTRLCDSKTCTKILKKILGGRDENSRRPERGEDTHLWSTCLLSKKMVARQVLNTARFIPIVSNSARQLPGLNADAYVSLPNHSVNELLFQLPEKGI